MKILCVGASGQIAQSLTEIGNSMDIELIARGRDQLNLLDPTSILSNVSDVSPSIIINAAAFTAVDQAESNVELAMDLNGGALVHLAKIADDHSIPLVHYSTDYVFDGSYPEPYTEDCQVSPGSVYGNSKLLGENSITDNASQYIILRTAWVYSSFGNNFVKTMLRLARDRDEISVVSDQVGSPTSSIDIARATLEICKQLSDKSQPPAWGIFHMSGTGTASWAEFAEEIFKISAALNGPFAKVKHIASEDFPSIVKRPANSRLNCSKLKTTYGVALPNWKNSLAETVARLIPHGN